MIRYRFQTADKAGPWRTSRLEAMLDAVGAGKALMDQVGGLRWRVPGEIEQSGDQAAAR